MSNRLRELAEENRTILCFGIDPDLERMRFQGGTIRSHIVFYYQQVLDKLLAEHQISAIKPNYAYFAQYGFDGLHALKDIIGEYHRSTFVILDGKRGDIGKSSEAYAKEMYDFWKADACTIHPYMGSDSVAPFVREGKIAYMQCRNSNPGARDFQDLLVGRKPLYEHVAAQALKWKTGLVVGATGPAIRQIVKITKNEAPFLIPGVGSQGGDLDMVLKAIKENLPIHRINASSSIAFAYEKQGGSPVDAALNEAQQLNQKIRRYF